MILEDGEFIDACFTDDTKSAVEATWHDFGVDRYYSVFIDVDLKDTNYQKLLEKFNLKQIKNNTFERDAAEREAYLSLVQASALESGLLYDPNNEDVSNRLNVDHLFELPEGMIGEEFLFNLKLRIFDMHEVMNCEVNEENSKLKTKLREAKTPIECLYLAGKFLYE